MIRFFLLQNKSGKTRLSKYYHPFADDEKVKMENEIHRIFMQRDASFTNFVEVCVGTKTETRRRICPISVLACISTSFLYVVQYKSFKLVYRRYAGLFFIFAIDVTDNELLYLESIHLFVEVCFRAMHAFPCCASSSSPVPLSFVVPSLSNLICVQILDHYFGNVCELDLVFGFHRAYCILDEFIIGGEVQETSKKVILQRIKELDSLET